jgi:uncharacterized protein (DUF1015 family)
MRLHAFEGLHYAVTGVEAGALAAPPYDQIDDLARDRFHAQSPHQFAQLTRPFAPGDADAAYEHAAVLHRSWFASGVIVRDHPPALYPYAIDLAEGGRRLGLMALVSYAPPTVIRPHEKTLDKARADRLALLEAMRVDLEPSLFLAEDDGGLEPLLAADSSGTPLVDHTDSDGHHHLLYRVKDPARIKAYRDLLENRTAAIADGHHRYQVGGDFARNHNAGPETAAGNKLAVITSIEAPALRIDPIHRALHTAPTATAMAALESLAVERTPHVGMTGTEFAAAVAAAPAPALGVWRRGQAPEIWRLKSGSGDALVVELFQHDVLGALGLGDAAATDGTLVYRSHPEDLAAQVERGDLAVGFYLPPMGPAEFSRAVARGDVLPPKSTRFLPKVMSGLVWADHGSHLG